MQPLSVLSPAQRARWSRLAQLSFWFLLLGEIILIGWWNLLLAQATLVAVLLLGGLGATWLIAQRRAREPFPGTPLDSGLLFLLIVIVLSSWQALDPSRSWRMAWQWLACAVAFYGAFTLLRRGWSRTAFAAALLLVLVLALLPAYAQLFSFLRQWFAAGPWPGWLPPPIPRLWGITNSANVLAILIDLGLFTCMALWSRAPTRQVRLLIVLWIAAALPILVFTASRGGWFGLLAGLAVMRLSATRRGRRLRQDLLLLAAGGVALVVVYFIRRADGLDLARELAVGFRLSYWRIAVEAWRADPLLGSGLNSFGTHYLTYASVPFGTIFNAAHNIFFQSLSDMGLLGAAALLLICGAFGRHVVRERRALDGWSRGLLGGVTAFLVHALLDTPEMWVVFPAACVLAALLAALPPPPPRRWRRAVPAVWALVWVALLAGGWLGYRRAALFEQAVAAASEGQWAAGLELLTAVQAVLPYPDSAGLQAEALLRSWVATVDARELERAITAQRALLRQEPGYSLNYANLAALEEANGADAAADAAMSMALARAPQVPLYWLNFALWAPDHGRARADRFAALYALEPTVGPPIPAPDGSQLPDSTLVWTIGQDPVRVQADLERAFQVAPYDARLSIALGIVHLRQGDFMAAEAAWRRAEFLATTSSGYGLGAIQLRQAIDLWRATLPGAEPGVVDVVKMQRGAHSAFGQGISGAVYTRELFDRRPLTFDLVPQLRCMAATAGWAAEVQEVAGWLAASQRRQEAEAIRSLLMGDGQGTMDCLPGEE